MNDAQQRAEQERRTYSAIHLAARGNADAEHYLRLIATVARMIDDLEDADQGKVDVGRLAHLLLVELPRNPFFCAHASCLVGLHDMAVNAWQDANQAERMSVTPLTRAWADLINEIACVVAGLCHGYKYRREVSLQIRTLLYDGESEGRDKGLGTSRPSLTPNHSSLTP